MNTKSIKLELPNVPITLDISKETFNGRMLVIADIHGCIRTLKALIKRLNLQQNDTLFFLGDYIDNGPDSKGVVDFIIGLKKQYRVYCLKGNHEAVYEQSKLDDPHGMKDKTGKLLPKYERFFNSLAYCIILQDFYLVHASINFKACNPFEDTEAMLWRSLVKPMKALSDKTIIRGHSKKPIQVIQEQILQKEKVITLDNGVQRTYAPYGNLCCLELKAWELTVQPNVDYPTCQQKLGGTEKCKIFKRYSRD